MTLDDYRQFYADEIGIAAGLKSAPLLAAYASVPREKFMGPPPWRIASADAAMMALMGLPREGYSTTENPRDLYHNVLVALDPARYLNNGQPGALARWIDALDLQAGDRVYHLGCGVGYYTAILAEVAGACGSVLASEVDGVLADRARANLAAYPNVSVHGGDGAAFDPGECDAIFINAGVTHPHPLWLQRLSPNGRIVLPLTAARDGTLWGSGIVAKITRRENGFSACPVAPVAIYSCTSVRDRELNSQLGRALASKALFKLRSVRTDPHDQKDTCLAHHEVVCLSTTDLPVGSQTDPATISRSPEPALDRERQ
ncbi:MAG TPA: rRNA adenine N-6-methyltransferase family protein [Bryobacteraceae bacterium]|nr:rRNA adenine N-6-methyltransferase family protein [Bryobacteraceae bacterium]